MDLRFVRQSLYLGFGLAGGSDGPSGRPRVVCGLGLGSQTEAAVRGCMLPGGFPGGRFGRPVGSGLGWGDS